MKFVVVYSSLPRRIIRMTKFTNEFSEEVWANTYKIDNEATLQDTFNRIAKGLSALEKDKEKWEKIFGELLSDFKFVPGGRILSNIGRENLQTTLYNCFVSAVQDLNIKDPDSIEGIYAMLAKQAQTLKSEGGYGVNGSWIRPEGSYVQGIASRTPGVLKFMELWDKSSEVITSGCVKTLDERRPGEKIKIRKGAQMLVLEVWHPEIEEFIIAKQTPNRLTKFNMSVGVTEGFMDAVQKNADWDLCFPDTTHTNYKKTWNGNIEKWRSDGNPVIVHKTIKAVDLWNSITKATYDKAEPGILFIDLCNELNPINYAEDVRCTNPCGEINMSTGVCCLGSLNLTQYIIYGGKKPRFDYESFERDIPIAIRALDNVQDVSKAPLKEYADSVKNKRRIGLGVMGLGSIHFILGIPFGSKESMSFISKLFKVKSETEILASALLGKEKGNFLQFDKSKHFQTHWWKKLKISKEVKSQVEKIGCMRNSHQSMNAPTGNTGIYANNVSGGIEPVFMAEYIRWSIVDEKTQSVLRAEGFEFPLVHKGQWFETDLMKLSKRGDDPVLVGEFNGQKYEIDKSRGLTKATLIRDYGWEKVLEVYSSEDVDRMNKEEIFKTTENLSVQEHLDSLAIVSHYTNQACSKTVNVPNKYPYEDFKDIYLTAWKRGIKGITTYREGTMSAVLESKNANKDNSNDIVETRAPKRPESLRAEIYPVKYNGENLYVALGFLKDGLYEVFAGINPDKDIKKSDGSIFKKSRGKYVFNCDDGTDYNLHNGHSNEDADSICRLLSSSLRHGVPLGFLVQQLEKTKGSLASFSKVICRVIKKHVKDNTKISGEDCPTCGNELIREAGCKLCKTCGHSVCG